MSCGIFIIGRGERADLALTDATVSRRHAMLRVTDDTVSVEDIGSMNGVIVGGHRIAGPTFLRHRDALQLGRTRIYLVEGSHSSSVPFFPPGAPTLTDRKEISEAGPEDLTEVADADSIGADSAPDDADSLSIAKTK